MTELNVQNVNENTRLDVFLSEKLENFSRAKIQELIKDKCVFINDKNIKASYIVQNGDNIRIDIPEKKEIEILPEPVKLDVRYEDDDILVINQFN